MAQLVLDVLINNQGQQALNQIVGQLGQLNQQGQKTAQTMTGMNTSAKSFFRTLAEGYAIIQSGRFFTGLITEGLKFNALLETSHLGLSALIRSFSDFSKNGTMITDPMERMKASLVVARELQNSLRIMAIKTPMASFADFLRTTEEAGGQALEKGFSIKEMEEFVRLVTIAARVNRIPENQIGQEARGILEGDTSRYSRLSRLFVWNDKIGKGIPGEIDRLARGRDAAGGNMLAGHIRERLKEFDALSKMLEMTLPGAAQSTREALEQALGEGTKGAAVELRDIFIGLRDELYKIDENGNLVFNQEFVDIVAQLTNGMVMFVKAIIVLGQIVPKVFGGFAGVILSIGGVLASVGEGFMDLFLNAIPTAVSKTFTWLGTQMQKHAGAIALLLPGTSKEEVLRDSKDFLNMGESVKGFVDNSWATDFRAGLKGMREGLFEAGASNFQMMMGNTPTKGGLAGLAVEDIFGSITRPLPPNHKELEKQAKAAERAAIAAARYAQMLDRMNERAVMMGNNKAFDAILSFYDEKIAGEKTSVGKINLETEKAEIKALFDYLEEEAKLNKLQDEIKYAIDQAVLNKTPRDLNREKAAFESLKQDRIANEINLASEIAKVRAEGEAKVIEDGRKLTEDVNKRTLENVKNQFHAMWDENYEKAHRRTNRFWDDMRESTQQGMRGIVQALFDGGDPMSEIFESFKSMWVESLGSMADSYLEMLTNIAAGKPYKKDPKTGGEVTMGQSGQNRAGFALAGLQAATALYGMHQNPGTSRGQNAVSGAMAGLGVGASLAMLPALAATPIGWILGLAALAGGAIGAFMPTEDGKNIKIGGSLNKGLGVTGLGGSGEWNKAKLERDIEQQVDDTAKMMDDVIWAIPGKILDRMLARRPKTGDINLTGKADGKNWNEELDNFLKFTVPQQVIGSYMPMLREALTLGGVEAVRIDQLFAQASKMDPSKAVDLLRKYVTVLFGLQEQFEFLNKSGADKTAFAMDEVNKTAPAKMATFDEQMFRLAQGFDDLTSDQQLARAEQIMGIMEQRYQTELQYLTQIQQLSESIAESIENQLFEIEMDQYRKGLDENGNPIYDTEKQTDALLGRQRDLWADLQVASTPEEVARITQELQQNATRLYDLMGRTPEAAEQITTMLTDANKIAQERLQILRAEVEEMDRLMRNVLESILRFLEGVAGVSTPGNPGNPGEGPDNPVPDPEDPTAIIVLSESAVAASASLDTFGETLLRWSGAFNGAAGSGAVAPVRVEAPQVNIHISGNIAPLIDLVEYTVGDVVEKKSMATAGRRAAVGRGNF